MFDILPQIIPVHNEGAKGSHIASDRDTNSFLKQKTCSQRESRSFALKKKMVDVQGDEKAFLTTF
jgi:hypothetical protein